MQWLYHWGSGLPPAGFYAFTFLWLFVESTGFPISDEPLLLLAGYLTTTQRVHMLPVLLIALTGKVLASCVAYAIGRHFDLERLARPAVRPAAGIAAWLHYLRPSQAFAQQAQQRFQRQGIWGVFLGRLIPVVRSFISYPAGAARMPFMRFLIATTTGSFIWIAFWTLLGAGLGRSYQQAEARWGTVSWLILAGLIAAILAVWLWSHRRAHAQLKRAPVTASTTENAEHITASTSYAPPSLPQ
ncbi:MAG: DedA family protein [Ktedonobacterales bacterium]